MKNRFSFLGCILCAVIVSTGCSSTNGPALIPEERSSYNQAIARSLDEQLLLNLVRLRYRDTPLFLEMNSVVSAYSFRKKGSAGGGVGWTNGTAASNLSIGGETESTEGPVVTYSPLRGEDFANRLLSPLSPITMLLLSQSGWSLERLLLCCVQHANDISNATAAAGPTPDYIPVYEQFHKLAHIFRNLQVAGLINVEMDKDGKTVLLLLKHDEDKNLQAEIRELRNQLGLDEKAAFYRITDSPLRTAPDEIAITGRSLLAVMFFLSQGVEAPPEHITDGLVTVTKSADGKNFDWE